MYNLFDQVGVKPSCVTQKLCIVPCFSSLCIYSAFEHEPRLQQLLYHASAVFAYIVHLNMNLDLGAQLEALIPRSKHNKDPEFKILSKGKQIKYLYDNIVSQ
jgi:hypothetical protein